MKSLNKEPLINWIQERNRGTGDQKEPAKTREIATQTGPWHQQGDKVEIRKIEDIDTVEKFLAVEKPKWNKDVFTNTEIKEGNPLSTKDDTVKVLLLKEGENETDTEIVAAFKNKYPELEAAQEDFEVLERTTKLRSKHEGLEKKHKIIQIVSSDKEEKMWEKMVQLREETAGDKWVALHDVPWFETRRLQKMMEVIFQGGETQVAIYIQNRREPKKELQQRQRNSYAFIVDQKGKDFKEVVQTLKNEMNNLEAKQAIKSIRATRSGKVLIVTEKNEEAFNQLQQSMARGIQDLHIVPKGPHSDRSKGTFYIRGMDCTTTKEEFMTCIGKLTNKVAGKDFAIGELRPNKNNTLAVTLTCDKETAETLDKERSIRIGMVRCGIEPKVEMQRCTKCWNYDHNSRECTGVDRRGQCFKCGGDDHLARDCKGENFCQLCNEKHKSGTRECGAFRKALINARKENRVIRITSQNA